MNKALNLLSHLVLLLLGVGTPALRLPAAHATMAELEQEVSRIEAEIAANKQKLKDFAGKKEEEQA